MGASVGMVLIITAALGAAVVAVRPKIRSARDALALLALTLLTGLPLWVTCDHHLLKILPTVWWFDPAEPFAPYFLLYLPLSLIITVTPAAAVISAARLCAARLRQGAAGVGSSP